MAKQRPKSKTKLEKYIDQLVEYFQPRMGLQQYDVVVKYAKRVGKDKDALNIAPEADGFAAECYIDFVYYEIKILLNRTKLEKKFRKMDFAYIASTVIHEMAHTYTERMYFMLWDFMKKTKVEREVLRQMNEQTVEHMTKVILSNHRQEAWMPREY